MFIMVKWQAVWFNMARTPINKFTSTETLRAVILALKAWSAREDFIFEELSDFIYKERSEELKRVAGTFEHWLEYGMPEDSEEELKLELKLDEK